MFNRFTIFILKYFKLLIIALCVLVILPYIISCQYIHPFFDDYFFANHISTNGPANFIRYFYLNWSGRYSEEILMAIVNARIVSAGNLQYVLFGVFTVLALFFSFYYLVQVLLKPGYSNLNRIVITLIAFAFYLVFMPELFTSFYWHCSSYYQLCLAFLLLNIGLIINLFKQDRNIWHKANLLLLNIFIAGFSEITVFSFGLLYFAIVLRNYSKYKQLKTFWLLLLIVFGTFALFNILSPGNLMRMNVAKSVGENGFIFSGARAFYDLIVFHCCYTFFKTPFLFLCILLIPWAVKYIKSGIPAVRIFDVHPVYSIITTLLIFYLQHALTLYGAGYSLQGRVFNFSILLFWMAFIYNLLVVLHYYSDKIILYEISPVIITWMTIVLIFLFNFSDNNRLLWGDLTRKLPKFDQQLHQRYQLILNAKKNGAKEVEVPLVTAYPKLYIFGEGARQKEYSFANEPKYLREASGYFKIIITTKE